MPNVKSAKKRMRQNEKRRDRNRIAKASLRTYLKKAEIALTGDNREEALEAVKTASRKLDKTAQKGIIHSNVASRSKSRLNRKLNKTFAS